MNLSDITNQFDAFISSTNDTSGGNNGNIQVETVTSSSQVSPIQQSPSIMDYEWPQMGTGTPIDWTQYAQQQESNVHNNIADNTPPTVNTSNVIPTNSQTVTPSEMNDLVNNLDINANHQFTSDNINHLAYQYVQQRGELIKPQTLPVLPPLQERLAQLFGYPSNTKTLPPTLCNFLQKINCVYPHQVINKLGGDRIQLAYGLAQAHPSTLFQQHFQELWILFAFCRDYIFSYPLDQRSFRARTWYQLRCKEAYDQEFYKITPEEFVEIREALLESSKEKSKIYMEGIYKMIIRWCNDDSTITDSESCASSSSNVNETQSNASSMTILL